VCATLTAMENPLLTLIDQAADSLPDFLAIAPDHIEPALDQVLADNRAQVRQILSAFDHSGNNQSPTWANLIQPLEDLDDRLNILWSTVSHLNSVNHSPALRQVYNQCLPTLSDYATEMSHNQKLYRAIQDLSESAEFENLNAAQKKVIEHELRDFKLAGVALPPEQKKQFADLQKKLSSLSAKFEENILDATHGCIKLAQVGL